MIATVKRDFDEYDFAECKQLEVEEIADLLTRFRAGDTGAGWQLVLSQQKLIAQRCAAISGYMGVRADELVQEFCLRLYERLSDYDPSREPLPWFTLSLLRRLPVTCRKLACRPLVTETCNRFAADPDYDVFHHSKQDSDYQWIIDKFAEIDDVIDDADVSPEGVHALRLLAHGMTREEVRDELLRIYPDALATQTGNWRDRLNALIESTINGIRNALGLENSPVRSLQNNHLTEDAVQMVLEIAFSDSHPSPQATGRECARRGTIVSYGFTYRFFKEFDVHGRRKLPDSDAQKEAILAEWRGRYTRSLALPSAADAVMPDALWDKIEPLVKGASKRATHSQHWRNWCNAILYWKRHACTAEEIPKEFGTVPQIRRWKLRLQELGLLDEVYQLAADHWPDAPELSSAKSAAAA